MISCHEHWVSHYDDYYYVECVAFGQKLITVCSNYFHRIIYRVQLQPLRCISHERETAQVLRIKSQALPLLIAKSVVSVTRLSIAIRAQNFLRHSCNKWFFIWYCGTYTCHCIIICRLFSRDISIILHTY